MGDVRNEPSMEDILASIKRIIAEDSATASVVQRGRRGTATVPTSFEPQEAAVPQPAGKPNVQPTDEPEEEVLELTDSLETAAASEDQVPLPPADEPNVSPDRPAPPADPRIVSESAAVASRQALAALSALVVKPEVNADNTLDGLVREMLRPMLKEWLDSRLPLLVEDLVQKEIARITGRIL